MPWEFNRSKRRQDAIAYRAYFKQWVCAGEVGRPPIVPDTVDRAEVIKIQAAVRQLYGTGDVTRDGIE